jgi:4-hydroxybenzoate polyprenyltransferase
MDAARRPARGLGERILLYGHMIRFSHSVFALPFALSGVLFAVHREGAWPPARVWLWVIVAMVGARSAAMAFNRIADARIDAANPRTRDREIPRGALSLATAWAFTVIAAAVFVLAAAMLNRLAFALSPLALAIVLGYSYTKRFTWASHLFLGLSLAVAPVGGWVAVTGRLDAAPFLLALGVLCWSAAFDVFYALQDMEFDREQGLRSIPARFGVRGAIGAARALHLGAVAALATLGPVLGLSVWYYAGLMIVAAILAYEHRLVKPNDLSRINRAFFDMNAVIGMVFLAAAAAGVML